MRLDPNLAGLRIAALTTTLDRKAGGAGVAFAYYARALRALGADVSLWMLTAGGPLLDQLAAEGFETRVLGLAKHSHRWSTSRALAEALAEAKPDWVHAHNYEPALHASRAKAAGAFRNLIMSHHDPNLRWSRRLFAWPYRQAPDAVILPSASAAKGYQRWFGYPADRMLEVTIPVADAFFAEPGNSESLARELGLEGCHPIVIWVARITRMKGHADLIRAMRQVVDRHPKARLLLVGSGKLEPAAEALAGELGLSQHVLFPGHRPDIAALLGVCDVFACPSHAETLCMAVQEAMAAGKPVVSTKVWGPADHIEDGRTGLLTPIGEVDALAACILRLADDAELAARLGSAAREYALANFTEARFSENLLRAYQTAMERSAAAD